MVTVRPARPADAEAIQELHLASIRELGAEAYDDEEVEAWAHTDGGPNYPIGDPEHVVVVAETIDGDLAGFGDVAPSEAELYAVYVHPEDARAGVGSSILEYLETAAREEGCERLELSASRNAVPFYEAAGYEPRETVQHEPSGPQEVCLECRRMVKELD